MGLMSYTIWNVELYKRYQLILQNILNNVIPTIIDIMVAIISYLWKHPVLSDICN